MRKILDFAYKFAASLSALAIFTIALLMIGQSFMREIGISTGPINEIVSWLCATAAFSGMAYAFKQGDFVRVGLLLERLDKRQRRYGEIAALMIAVVACLYLAFWATSFTYESLLFNDIATGLLPMPLWIPQCAFVLGSWLFAIATIDECFIAFFGGEPSYVTAVRERHARGDFSSDL
ncbi:MAG: TRAP transporter small permease [Betaproteobacteria bacterium]|jgi:TRAP-type C4-dicarboxylate transport system permease small subunit|nr:TRAP transporter small permease [Betaproteobacteria bacterium]